MNIRCTRWLGPHPFKPVNQHSARQTKGNKGAQVILKTPNQITHLPEVVVLTSHGKNPDRVEASAVLVTQPAAGGSLLIMYHVAKKNVLEKSSHSVICNATGSDFGNLSVLTA